MLQLAKAGESKGGGGSDSSSAPKSDAELNEQLERVKKQLATVKASTDGVAPEKWDVELGASVGKALPALEAELEAAKAAAKALPLPETPNAAGSTKAAAPEKTPEAKAQEKAGSPGGGEAAGQSVAAFFAKKKTPVSGNI